MALSADQRGEIFDLAARYCHTIDLGDPDGWVACFTDDGVFEGPGMTLKGPEELRKLASRNFPHPIRHLPSVFALEGDANAASMLCYFTVLQLSDPPKTVAVGRYEDEIVRVDGAWKFQRRVAHMDWADPTLLG